MSESESESEFDLELELLIAADKGDEEKVTALIRQGVDVNCQDWVLEDTPLHNAASGGHVGVAELLLKAGAQVDSRDQFGNSPLHHAASGGHVGVAELLLKAGAQVDSRDSFGKTPLHKAASGAHLGVVELLLKAGAQVDSRAEFAVTLLHSAASGGHVGVVELLLKAGAQVDSRDPFGNSPLHRAASGGHVGVAELLLKAGAQVDSRDPLGNTPIHNAASGGHVGVVELLLKAGAQVDSRDQNGDTSLHSAASGGHVGVAELLLKAGAQVDSRSRLGWTPEDIAARTDVLSQSGKDRVLKGRKKILELFAAEKLTRPFTYKLKMGPEGGNLKTAHCTVSVPRGAVTMETDITCQVINPNDVTLPLKDGEMLVSDVIELGPHGTTFRKPVTVQMQYNSKSPSGAMEAAVWVTGDRSQWTELKTTEESEDKLSVSVDHFSIFAVISQPKQDKFTVPTEGFKLTSSTQPAVQISFPEQAVNTETQVTIQVQEVPTRAIEDIKAEDQSFVNLVGTSPIVNVETVSTSEVPFHKPVTVRVPHPQHYMNIQHEGPTKLRVMSCEEGTEDWMDVTDNVTISRVTEEFVEFDVTHFTRWIVILVEDILGNTEKLGPIPTEVCQWLQRRPVQFILLQREDDAKLNEFRIECTLDGSAEQNRPKLMPEAGYKASKPSGTEHLFEGQQVNIRFQGNVKLARYDARRPKQITFHSQQYNRLHVHLTALKDGENSGVENYFYFIKKEVSTGWRDLAFHLGFKWADIDNIASKDGNRDDKSRCMDMLQEWKKKKGDAATIEVLMEALSKAELQSVVDGLKTYSLQVGNYGKTPPARGEEASCPP
ncbi:positive regulation of extrinsic apoptotic signaling pathway via death domain receptors protein [Branchiostoma belcheri]|nr:positive regulation of extrinsic apoptotic signaling pathway via death domain receptors protein [Branchiostoma belcheri]